MLCIDIVLIFLTDRDGYDKLELIILIIIRMSI